MDALQTYEASAWRRYVALHSQLNVRSCPGCGNRFVPLSGKQRFCTVRCRESHPRNLAYFGGRRQEAVGLREGVCQLCRRKSTKWLAAHHVLGKERDPDNETLIALCRGCHDLVTRISSRPWVERPDMVADLIALALARRGRTRAFVSVDIDDWTEAEIRDYFHESDKAIHGAGRKRCHGTQIGSGLAEGTRGSAFASPKDMLKRH